MEWWKPITELLRLHIDTAELARKLLDRLPLRPQVVPVMTYRAAIEYFVNEAPPEARVSKGIMLRRPHPNGYLFLQTFLDGSNGLVTRPDGAPHGRRLIVNRLDPELDDIFGDQDLVVVE
jgi:hypothetical protein